MESEGRKKEKKTVFILLLLCRFKDKFFNFFLAVLTGTVHTPPGEFFQLSVIFREKAATGSNA